MLRRKTFFIFNFFGGGFFASPDRAHREQPIGGLKKFVRARVRSAWRVGVYVVFESANFRMLASIIDDPKATKKSRPWAAFFKWPALVCLGICNPRMAATETTPVAAF